MQGPKRQTPLIRLGERLKRLRETRMESLAEVSGAVEIESEMLERIENGEECPSEDILMLLINYFAVHEQEAVQFWEWAGYSHGDNKTEALSDLAAKATLVLVALDSRVLYSDEMTVTGSDSGIVLNFLQAGLQAHGQQVPIARIGVSYEQAAQIVRELEKTLLKHRYFSKQQLLPPGEIAKED